MTAIIVEKTVRLIPDILATRRNDGENGWVQLLIFLVMAVFFVISNIARSRSRKQQEEQGEIEEEPLFQIRRRPAAQREVPAGRLPERKPAYETSVRTKIPVKIISHKMPQPTTEEVIAPQPVEGLTETRFEAPPDTAKPDVEISTPGLTELEKPDELARGIIYSEILGKPLALREPWGNN